MTSTTSTIPTTVIERSHLRAIRNADSIVFRTHEGQSTIELKLGAHRSKSGFEQTEYLYCKDRITDYSRAHTFVEPDERAKFYSAFHMEHTGVKYNPDLESVMARIKVGDLLGLHWTTNNSSTNTDGIGWVRDELRLEILHLNGTAERYLVEVNVGPDNSARMVRRKF
jgi:hypothetical protein